MNLTWAEKLAAGAAFVCLAASGVVLLASVSPARPGDRHRPPAEPGTETPVIAEGERTRSALVALLRASSIPDLSRLPADEPEPAPESGSSAQPPVPEAPLVAAQIQLIGIAIGHSSSTALVIVDRDPAQWIRIGDSIADALVIAIDSEGIILASDQNEFRINLYDENEGRAE